MGKNHYILTILLLSVINIHSFSQHKVLMEEDVDLTDVISKNGPNERHFFRTRIFYGLGINPEGETLPVKTISSGEFEVFLRYKLKICSILSTGLSAGYISQRFPIRSDQKSFPDQVIYDRQVFQVHSFKPSIFLRFNIDPRRGNYLGKFIEGGVFGTWSFNQKRIMVTRYDESSESDIKKSREVQSGLDYIRKTQYGTYVSIGFANYELSYRYRISRFIDEEVYNYDFPANSLGLSIGLNF